MVDMDNILDELPALQGISSLIMVAGVGGAGGNAVSHMHRIGINGVNFLLCNTDRQALDNSPVERKIQLGDGLGAGNDASVGEQKAKQSLEEIRNCFKSLNTRLLFLAAGMGGGTGTGASPVIAQLAREMGILTVAIVTMPSVDEGPLRMEQACLGLEKLRSNVDSLIVLSNDAIDDLYGNMPLSKAFDKANDVLALAAKGIAEIVTIKSNLVNVDFADVHKVLTNSGCAVIGVSSASGSERAETAIDASLSSPLFGGASISGARNVLLNLAVSSPDSLTANEAKRARERVQYYASYKDERGRVVRTNIIWGTSVKPELAEDELEAIVVVTGFPPEYYNNVFNGEPVEEEEDAGVEIHADTVAQAPVAAPAEADEDATTTAVELPESGKIEMVPRSATFFADIERRKSRPAFRSRNVMMIERTGGPQKRAVNHDADAAEEAATAEQTQTPDLFG